MHAVTPLRRHQLARLSDAGWSDVLARRWDGEARECLAHWAAHHLPLVVTRQPADVAADSIALGLPAPARWERRRLALQVPRGSLLYFDEFPQLADVQKLLPSATRVAVHTLLAGLTECGTTAQIFGGHGWQALTGLDYLRPGSDLDLWVSVASAEHADAVTLLLQSFAAPAPRLDGEILFRDGTAVAWREWVDWRNGCARAVLVKQLAGVALLRDAAWFECTGLPALTA
jgi:phosphoribosyl-dephospho-CoA transferase